MNLTHVITLFYTNFSLDATLFYTNFSLDATLFYTNFSLNATLFYTNLSFFGWGVLIATSIKIKDGTTM